MATTHAEEATMRLWLFVVGRLVNSLPIFHLYSANNKITFFFVDVLALKATQSHHRFFGKMPFGRWTRWCERTIRRRCSCDIECVFCLVIAHEYQRYPCMSMSAHRGWSIRTTVEGKFNSTFESPVHIARAYNGATHMCPSKFMREEFRQAESGSIFPTERNTKGVKSNAHPTAFTSTMTLHARSFHHYHGKREWRPFPAWRTNAEWLIFIPSSAIFGSSFPHPFIYCPIFLLANSSILYAAHNRRNYSIHLNCILSV